MQSILRSLGIPLRCLPFPPASSSHHPSRAVTRCPRAFLLGHLPQPIQYPACYHTCTVLCPLAWVFCFHFIKFIVVFFAKVFQILLGKKQATNIISSFNIINKWIKHQFQKSHHIRKKRERENNVRLLLLAIAVCEFPTPPFTGTVTLGQSFHPFIPRFSPL